MMADRGNVNTKAAIRNLHKRFLMYFILSKIPKRERKNEDGTRSKIEQAKQ